VYLNRDWQESYGGQLELWDRQIKRCVQRIAPVFNRAVIFRTDPDSFHGHPDPMICPTSFTRKSLALYYFTDEPQPFMVRSTEYRARPGDGARAVWIYLDKMALRGYDKVKRRFGLSDRFASDLLKRLGRRKDREDVEGNP
jgi:2OG-Fe(II) oxygenase superfamily